MQRSGCPSDNAAQTHTVLPGMSRRRHKRTDIAFWLLQLDAKDAAIAALKREVALLRAENQYLRDQVGITAGCPPRQDSPAITMPQKAATGYMPYMGTCPHDPLSCNSRHCSILDMHIPCTEPLIASALRLCCWLGVQLDAADSAGQALTSAMEEGTPAVPLAAPTLMTPRMRLAASQASSQGVEPLMARIAEAEALLVRYSKENERLATVNNRLQFKREFVDTDYTGQAPRMALGLDSIWLHGARVSYHCPMTTMLCMRCMLLCNAGRLQQCHTALSCMPCMLPCHTARVRSCHPALPGMLCHWWMVQKLACRGC